MSVFIFTAIMSAERSRLKSDAIQLQCHFFADPHPYALFGRRVRKVSHADYARHSSTSHHITDNN